jgi:putative transposase
MGDSLTNGRKVRLFIVLEHFNRESLAIEDYTLLRTSRLIRVLNKPIAELGSPSNLRMDNGPESISHQREEWSRQKQILLQSIQPGIPMHNAFIERKNGNTRRELLNADMFESLNEVCVFCEELRVNYNTKLPPKSLGHLSPLLFGEQWFKRSRYKQTLYPQMATRNDTKKLQGVIRV